MTVATVAVELPTYFPLNFPKCYVEWEVRVKYPVQGEPEVGLPGLMASGVVQLPTCPYRVRRKTLDKTSEKLCIARSRTPGRMG